MQAVILAAGRGLRLNGRLGGKPKCLARIGGRTLIEHQIAALRELGVASVCVVVGCGARAVRAHVGTACATVVNERYRETNSLYSLLLVRRWVRGPFVLLNGDVLACREIYRRVVSAAGTTLAYDSRSGREDEHMKVRVREGRLEHVAKELGDGTDGENVGILKFDEPSARLLFAQGAAMLANGGRNAWAPAAVDRIASGIHVQAVDVAGLPWIEIDYPEDLDDARWRVWPAIRDADESLVHASRRWRASS